MLGIKQIGTAAAVSTNWGTLDPVEEKGKIMLTPEETGKTGAMWWGEKLHLENGFETFFRFKIASACVNAGGTDCNTGDGFAFVITGSENPDQIGCGGRALGFASDPLNNCTAGIANSFAVEFDTWHNTDMKDINVRGTGSSGINATQSTRWNYVHTAFFSQTTGPNSANHTKQLAGTPAIPTITDGELHSVKLVYIPGATATAPGRAFLYIDDMQSFVLTAPIRLGRMNVPCDPSSKTDRCILDSLGNAFIGFTGATGEMGQSHEIYDWTFCDEPNCGR